MSYKEELLRILKHKDDDVIELNSLKYYLWYSYTTQSYLQRSDIYDNSLLIDKKYDAFISLLLLYYFKLDDLFIYETKISMDNDISSLSSTELNRNIMYISLDSKTLFINYYDKLRNSLAHGSFNKVDLRYYFLGQYSAKKDSLINFLLQSNTSFNTSFEKIDSIIKGAKNNYILFQYKCLNLFLDLEFKDIFNNVKRYYSKTYHKYIIIDNYFSFVSKKYSDEIKELLKKYDFLDETVVIIMETRSNFSESTLTSDNGKVRIVSINNLIKYFNIDKIHTIK